MSNLQLYNQNIPANGQMILDAGNFFFLMSAAASCNLLFVYGGNTEIMNGVSAGLQVKRTRLWRQCILKGSAGTNVQFFHGEEFSREDDTSFQAQIATISGNVAVTPAAGSANAITYHNPDVTITSTTLDTTIAANTSRKNIIIGALSTNAPGAGLSLRIQGGSGVAAAAGMELQPGTNYQFQSTGAFPIYNPAAVTQKYWYMEQT